MALTVTVEAIKVWHTATDQKCVSKGMSKKHGTHRR
jgi:hypothetical protein